VATRFDKLAVRYQATIAVADIFIWLRAKPDRSRGDPRNTPYRLTIVDSELTAVERNARAATRLTRSTWT